MYGPGVGEMYRPGDCGGEYIGQGLVAMYGPGVGEMYRPGVVGENILARG